MINLMEIPKKLAIPWIIETKAISPFTRNFVEWLYENGFAISNHGCDDMNFEMKKKIQEYWRKIVHEK